jgi:hypothetical protein
MSLSSTSSSRAFALALFALCTAGAGVWDLVRPLERAQLAGDERAADAQRRANASLWDGSLTALWADDLEERANVRRHLLPYYTAALVLGLREGHDDVIVGRGGWLFLASRSGALACDPADLGGLGASLFATLERRLHAYGVRLVLVPVPRRSVYCEEFLPSGYRPDGRLEEAYLARLGELGVDFVDPRVTFAGRAAAEVFYRQDTHWNRRARLWTAEAMCARVGALRLEAERAGQLERGPFPETQGLVRSLGVPQDSGAARWLEPADEPMLVPQGEDIRALTAPAASGMTARAHVGTSFSDGLLLQHLRHFSAEPLWDATSRGTQVRISLARFLRRHRKRLPEVLFVEYPLFQLLNQRFEGGEVRLSPDELGPLDALRPRHLSLLVTGAAPRANGAPGTGDAPPLLVLETGALATRGNGAVLVRVRGAQARRNMRVSLRAGPVSITVPWGSEESALSIPLLLPAGGAPEVELVLSGAGSRRFEADAVELVTEFDLEGGVVLSPGPVRARAGGWEQDYAIDTPAPLPRHAALFLGAGAQGCSARLVLVGGAASGALGALELRAGGVALWTIDAPGDPPRALRLAGDGAPPSAPLTGARLVFLP